ncbi:MAG TPA: DUF2272 domain-containing protein [Xylella sp.]
MSNTTLIRLLAISFWLCAWPALAVDICEIPPHHNTSPAAQGIARAACEENRLWLQPFIDHHGRIASLTLTEAENDTLANQELITWQRVALYWRESGTLAMVSSEPGSSSCAALDGSRSTTNDCRAFLLDTPWSAAFVSWVMTHVGLSGFPVSSTHIDYIRASYLDPSGPYRFANPATEKPKAGDLLCMLRERDHPLGYAGLRAALEAGITQNWSSHCDIVVTANVNGDHTLYLVGGNVSNTVMMRKLPLDHKGRLQLSVIQKKNSKTAPNHKDKCTPTQENNCNFNRHDWAALLKLRPNATLVPPEDKAAATSTSTAPMPAAPPQAAPQDSNKPIEEK